MANYKRANISSGTYFFTVVTFKRRPILCDEKVRRVLRQSIIEVRKKYPFKINAWVLLPDHLHCIWTLPSGDFDLGKRWSLIKRMVSQQCMSVLQLQAYQIDKSRRQRRELFIWQRRFWEHQIRDQDDFISHLNYLHFNPVKHGYVTNVSDWPFSTFKEYVKQGYYDKAWGKDDINQLGGKFDK